MNIKKFGISLLIGSLVALQSPLSVIAEETTNTPTPTPTLTYRESLRQRSNDIISSYYDRYGFEQPTPTPETYDQPVSAETSDIPVEQILENDTTPNTKFNEFYSLNCSVKVSV